MDQQLIYPLREAAMRLRNPTYAALGHIFVWYCFAGALLHGAACAQKSPAKTEPGTVRPSCGTLRASWLNQVELWFAKIERDLLARGIFTSLPDLARKIRRYITRYNEDPKPIRWTYSNPAHRITTHSAVTVH
jgi:hypothetical protein